VLSVVSLNVNLKKKKKLWYKYYIHPLASSKVMAASKSCKRKLDIDKGHDESSLISDNVAPPPVGQLHNPTSLLSSESWEPLSDAEVQQGLKELRQAGPEEAERDLQRGVLPSHAAMLDLLREGEPRLPLAELKVWFYYLAPDPLRFLEYVYYYDTFFLQYPWSRFPASCANQLLPYEHVTVKTDLLVKRLDLLSELDLERWFSSDEIKFHTLKLSKAVEDFVSLFRDGGFIFQMPPSTQQFFWAANITNTHHIFLPIFLGGQSLHSLLRDSLTPPNDPSEAKNGTLETELFQYLDVYIGSVDNTYWQSILTMVSAAYKLVLEDKWTVLALPSSPGGLAFRIRHVTSFQQLKDRLNASEAYDGHKILCCVNSGQLFYTATALLSVLQRSLLYVQPPAFLAPLHKRLPFIAAYERQGYSLPGPGLPCSQCWMAEPVTMLEQYEPWSTSGPVPYLHLTRFVVHVDERAQAEEKSPFMLHLHPFGEQPARAWVLSENAIWILQQQPNKTRFLAWQNQEKCKEERLYVKKCSASLSIKHLIVALAAL
jgi:hypothetical protein